MNATLETALFVNVILNLHLALPNANVPDAKHVCMFFTQLKFNWFQRDSSSHNLFIYLHLLEFDLCHCLPTLPDAVYWRDSKTALSTRFSDHLRSIRSNLPGRPVQPVAALFNSTGHTIEHAKITGILSTSGNLDHHSSKQRIISKLTDSSYPWH